MQRRFEGFVDMTSSESEKLKQYIRRIPEFKGVVFWDITTLLKDGDVFCSCVEEISKHFKSKDVDVVVSPEARGFILGAAVAHEMKVGFIPIRKSGKLPSKTISLTYAKEYEKDTIEMHEDAISKGDRVLFVDDLLATGGSALASIRLIEGLCGKVVGLGFLIELEYLNARFNEKVKNRYDVFSLVKYRNVSDI
jgi:adenine phosphoribosyltransferase